MKSDEDPVKAHIAENAARLEEIAIPTSVLDLLRFMCATWAEIDEWAYKHCDADALGHYPVVQGTGNQIKLRRIGEQPHDTTNIHNAVEWMQRFEHRAHSQYSTENRAMTETEFKIRYGNRLMQKAGLDEKTAADAADAAWPEYCNRDHGYDEPAEEHADEEILCWSD
jgi:hypothetical protein